MTTSCQNCESPLTGQFCSNCGQKADEHRITIGHVIHETIHAVTHADKGIFHLIRELIYRPGFVAREYITGKRKRYFNPLSFLVISSALMAYVSIQTGYYDALVDGGPVRTDTSETAISMWQEAKVLVRNNFGKTLSLFLIAPLFAALCRMFFYGSRFNFAENFVLNAFIFGEAAIFRAIVSNTWFVIAPWQSAIIYAVYELCFMVYIIVAFRQFYNQPLWLTIIKAIVIRITFIIVFWGVVLGYVFIKHLIT